MRELVRPVLNRQCSACESGMVSICCDSASLIIDEEFEVEKCALSLWKATQDVGPAALVLVAVCELDVSVNEWDCIYELASILIPRYVILGGRGDVQVSSGSSFNPRIMWSAGASRHVFSGTNVAPTFSNSSSSKMRSGERSMLTLYPASSSALVVVGVSAERCSSGLPSLRQLLRSL